MVRRSEVQRSGAARSGTDPLGVRVVVSSHRASYVQVHGFVIVIAAMLAPRLRPA